MTRPAYLDNAATTPVDPRVLEAMLPHMGGRRGNPSSLHASGAAAREAVEEAREEVAKYVEREEVSPSIAAGVNVQLDEMAHALAS